MTKRQSQYYSDFTLKKIKKGIRKWMNVLESQGVSKTERALNFTLWCHSICQIQMKNINGKLYESTKWQVSWPNLGEN